MSKNMSFQEAFWSLLLIVAVLLIYYWYITLPLAIIGIIVFRNIMKEE